MKAPVVEETHGGWLCLERTKRRVVYGQSVNVRPGRAPVLIFDFRWPAHYVYLAMESREHTPVVSYLRHARSAGTWTATADAFDHQRGPWSPWFRVDRVGLYSYHRIAEGLEDYDEPLAFAVGLCDEPEPKPEPTLMERPRSGVVDVYLTVVT